MKKIISTILAIAMVFSILVVFTVNAFSESDETANINKTKENYVDENGRTFFEKNNDAIMELYSESEEITTIVPIKAISKEEATEDSMSLLTTNAEKTVTVVSISSYDFYMSEKTITVDVSLEEFYDAKNKLKISVIDADDNVVAQQTSCVYDYGWGSVLRYTLNVVDGVTISSEEDYDIKMTYTGAYDFVCDTSYTQVYPDNQAAVIRAEIVNKSENIFAFYIANFDSETDYAIELKNVKYEPISIEDNCINFKLDDIDTSDAYDYHTLLGFTLYEKNGDYYSYCDTYYMEYFEFGEEYADDYYHGISTVDKIAVDADSFWAYVYKKENGLLYSAKDAENAVIYMVDSVTGNKVATSAIEYDAEYSEIVAKMNLTGTLISDRRYFIVVDDGETIRLRAVLATDKPCYRFCGVKQGDVYYSLSFVNADKYEFVIFDAYNMTDISKISAAIYDTAGNQVITFDKGSIKNEGSTSAATNKITFTMSRQMVLDEEEQYYFKFMYDQYVVENEEWYYEGGTSTEFNGWVYDVYSTEDTTYLLFAYHSEEYDETDLEFVLKDNATETELSGQYQRTLDDDYYKYITVKFDGVLEGYYGDISLIIKSCSKELYNNSSFSISKISLPFVYGYSNRNENGYITIYGEGFKDGNVYDLYLFDLVTNSEKKVSLSKVNGKNEFKIPVNDLNVILEEDGYIEENGTWVGYVNQWILDVNYSAENEFYAKYKNQNHKLAILYLPIKDYSQYKIADSKEVLDSKSFKAIERNVLYTLSEGEGEKIIYAQFKKANGELSEVMKTTVMIDMTKPVLSNISDLSGTYNIDYNQQLQIPITLTASESGNAEIAIYNKADCIIGYERSKSINVGENKFNLYFYADDYDYTNAKKLVISMTDNAGNVSEKYSYDISVINKYTQYAVGDGYILLNNETGIIEEVEVDVENLTIPSSINGVSVKGIGDYAFEYCYNLKSISIPESVETISEDAFYGVDDVTLKVKENSEAHKFAVDNEMDYQIVTVEPGDITGDGKVNSMDLLRLAKHFAGWDVEVDETASDVTGDGKVNSMDLLRLAKYFAGWDVTLGQ